MLRICFTGEDIARTRLAPRPDPLWELVLGLQMLHPQRGDLLFRSWRREARLAFQRPGHGRAARLLMALTPNVGYFPDFLNPIEAAHGFEHGLEAIRRTPKTSLRRDIRQLAESRTLPNEAKSLAAGDPAALVDLTDAMRIGYERIIVPYHRNIELAVNHDWHVRGKALADGGVEGMLASLRPMMSWSAGELRVPTHRDQELHLNGRGLLLVPSYFCVGGPLTLFDPDLPPVLIYPVRPGPDLLPTRDATVPHSLAALIGENRAAVLHAIAAGETTTTQLATRVGVSAGSASEHASVLRDAGLVSSRRDRHRVLHNATRLGLTLLQNQTG